MEPVTEPSALAISGSYSRAGHVALAAMAGAMVLAVLSACDPPLGLGQPTTRSLESGAAETLSSATSFVITGSYTENLGDPWTIALSLVRPDRQEMSVSSAKQKLDAIIIGNDAYFRGQVFLAQHMGSDAVSQGLVKAAGNAWWKGSAANAPQLLDFADGSNFQSTFLGTAVTQRTDHVSIDGLDAIELSGPRADIFIRATPPYYVLHVRMKKGVVIDGFGDADLRYSNFGNRNIEITAPTDVIDFSNLSTLPPIYTVVSVDTSKCLSSCVVSATIKNLGGMNGARAPSTITFTMTASASKSVVGSCLVQVVPDVGYNGTATVSCTIATNGQQGGAAIVTASADNPGRA